MKVTMNTIDNFFREIIKHSTDHHHALRCKWCFKHSLADVTEFENSNDFVLVFVHSGLGSWYQLQDNNCNILIGKIDGPYSVSYNTDEDYYSLVIAGSEIVLTFFEDDYKFVPQKKEEQEEDKLALVLEKLDEVDRKLDMAISLVQLGQNVRTPVNLPYKEYPWQKRTPLPYEQPFQTYCTSTASN